MRLPFSCIPSSFCEDFVTALGPPRSSSTISPNLTLFHLRRPLAMEGWAFTGVRVSLWATVQLKIFSFIKSDPSTPFSWLHRAWCLLWCVFQGSVYVGVPASPNTLVFFINKLWRPCLDLVSSSSRSGGPREMETMHAE